ncbi:MAG: 30S ribosomal protein S9 [Candidatus Omnitrophica bacterium CG11_big_fil_rev_8_21_14_0_20_64_10]|nr:MAG: 30S ribosomal protein S9 [Candidatus Omnitrophica bacterium CG11_big_fil_rev_8_21_14_0_20_64_10]
MPVPQSTGRRKEAVARVRIRPGKGILLINGRQLNDYFPRVSLQIGVREPLTVTQTAEKYDCIARVGGGGLAGQAGAVRHALARALVKENETYKAALRSAGFLTRDPRAKERKKYGQKGARKRFQWTKR